MTRLVKINPIGYHKLDAHDECWHIGEYTAGGGFGASETNQSILNLKKRPPVPANQVWWKDKAIQDWGNKLASLLNLEATAASVTLVPAPCSRPAGHPEYDNRMLRVLHQVASNYPESVFDIRPVLITPVARAAQHEGERLTINELIQSMAVDQAQLQTPLRKDVLVVDDVFTQGGTFKAMQSILLPLQDVERVAGIFLAKTVWPVPDFDEDAFVI